MACPGCGQPVGSAAALCPACGALQEVRAADHFAVLGVPARFDLDPADLERRFFALQRRLHPDRFATGAARERALSLRHSTRLNEAYRVLKDPLARAEHLLARAGRPVQADGAQTVSDPELLMEAMAMREQLAEAEDAAAIDRLLQSARAAVAAIEDELARAFAANDLTLAGALALRLRYRNKLIDEARERHARM